MPTQRSRFRSGAQRPGFIGFSLLAHDLCETLRLADTDPEPVAACRGDSCRRPIGVPIAFRSYRPTTCKRIPSSERWDLVDLQFAVLCRGDYSKAIHIDEYSGRPRATIRTWRVTPASSSPPPRRSLAAPRCDRHRADKRARPHVRTQLARSVEAGGARGQPFGTTARTATQRARFGETRDQAGGGRRAPQGRAVPTRHRKRSGLGVRQRRLCGKSALCHRVDSARPEIVAKSLLPPALPQRRAGAIATPPGAGPPRHRFCSTET